MTEGDRPLKGPVPNSRKSLEGEALARVSEVASVASAAALGARPALSRGCVR
jgi:hypothetical protein